MNGRSKIINLHGPARPIDGKTRPGDVFQAVSACEVQPWYRSGAIIMIPPPFQCMHKNSTAIINMRQKSKIQQINFDGKKLFILLDFAP